MMSVSWADMSRWFSCEEITCQTVHEIPSGSSDLVTLGLECPHCGCAVNGGSHLERQPGVDV